MALFQPEGLAGFALTRARPKSSPDILWTDVNGVEWVDVGRPKIAWTDDNYGVQREEIVRHPVRSISLMSSPLPTTRNPVKVGLF